MVRPRLSRPAAVYKALIAAEISTLCASTSCSHNGFILSQRRFLNPTHSPLLSRHSRSGKEGRSSGKMRSLARSSNQDLRLPLLSDYCHYPACTSPDDWCSSLARAWQQRFKRRPPRAESLERPAEEEKRKYERKYSPSLGCSSCSHLDLTSRLISHLR